MSDEKKYLSISMDVGKALQEAFKAMFNGQEKVYFSVFDNTENLARNSNSPIYTNNKDGVAVWLRTPKKKAKNPITDEVEDNE